MRFVSACLWCVLVTAPVAAQATEPVGVLGAAVATAETNIPMTALVPAQKIVTAPEPGTLLLVGTGLVGFAITLRHRRRAAK